MNKSLIYIPNQFENSQLQANWIVTSKFGDPKIYTLLCYTTIYYLPLAAAGSVELNLAILIHKECHKGNAWMQREPD